MESHSVTPPLETCVASISNDFITDINFYDENNKYNQIAPIGYGKLDPVLKPKLEKFQS